MNKSGLPSQYLKIALDLAQRIVRGDFAEGSRIYGRSILASDYNVSPETIRRALRLLGDMKVVDIVPQSGVTVLSVDSARRYIENFQEETSTELLRSELHQRLEECQALQQRIGELANSLVNQRYTVSATEQALPNYEVVVPAHSALIGKSVGELNFWQATGSTIVAIRRGTTVLLSPGPYAELYRDDVIILVGTPSAAAAAHHLVTAGMED